MSWYVWDQSLDIKVAKMNDEHKVLIDLMNQLHAQHEAKEQKPALLKTFQNLVDYTRQHFSEEEQYLQSIDYPDFKIHKLIHTKLLGDLDKHFQKFQLGNGEIKTEVFLFLKVWLNAHIKGVDMQYGQYSIDRLTQKKRA